MYYIDIEIAQDLLNDAVAAYTMIGIKDKSKKEETDKNKKRALDILAKSENFLDKESVKRIIEEYSPIVKSLYPKTT